MLDRDVAASDCKGDKQVRVSVRVRVKVRVVVMVRVRVRVGGQTDQTSREADRQPDGPIKTRSLDKHSTFLSLAFSSSLSYVFVFLGGSWSCFSFCYLWHQLRVYPGAD
jgi:hypothetical protein